MASTWRLLLTRPCGCCLSVLQYGGAGPVELPAGHHRRQALGQRLPPHRLGLVLGLVARHDASQPPSVLLGGLLGGASLARRQPRVVVAARQPVRLRGLASTCRPPAATSTRRRQPPSPPAAASSPPPAPWARDARRAPHTAPAPSRPPSPPRAVATPPRPPPWPPPWPPPLPRGGRADGRGEGAHPQHGAVHLREGPRDARRDAEQGAEPGRPQDALHLPGRARPRLLHGPAAPPHAPPSRAARARLAALPAASAAPAPSSSCLRPPATAQHVSATSGARGLRPGRATPGRIAIALRGGPGRAHGPWPATVPLAPIAWPAIARQQEAQEQPVAGLLARRQKPPTRCRSRRRRRLRPERPLPAPSSKRPSPSVLLPGPPSCWPPPALPPAPPRPRPPALRGPLPRPPAPSPPWRAPTPPVLRPAPRSPSSAATAPAASAPATAAAGRASPSQHRRAPRCSGGAARSQAGSIGRGLRHPAAPDAATRLPGEPVSSQHQQ